MRSNHFVVKALCAVLLLLGGVLPLPAQATEQQAVTLDEVVITASRTEESTREISSNITVINERDIEGSTASTLADLVEQNGFFVVTTGDTTNVQIRGFGNLSMTTEAENTVLILVNGRRIGNSNLAMMGLSNVKQVEIIRGPAAVQYGSSALGGVINIITGKGTSTPYVSAEAGFGSDALHREKFSFGGAGKGFDFALGITNYGSGDVTTSGGRRWYHSEIGHNTLLNADLGYTIADNHRAGINFNYSNVGSKLSSGNSGIRPYSDNTPDAPYAQHHKNNHNLALNYAGHTDDKSFDWSASFSFGRDEREYSYIDTVKNRVFNAQVGYTAELVSLSVGVDNLEYKSMDTPYRPTSTMDDTGVYFTGKLRLLDERFILSAGGRYDAYTNDSDEMSSKSDNNFGGSVGASFLPVQWLKLRVNYAEGFKMPSPGQVGASGTWYVPNPALKPEKSKTIEFGADVSANNISGSLTYFHSDWENKIVALYNMSAGKYQYQNLKASTLAGIEGALRFDISQALGQNYNIAPYAGFTWLGTRENKDESRFFTYQGSLNRTMPNTPEWMASYGLDYSHPGYKFKARLSANRYGTVLTQDWSVVDYVTVFSAPYIERPAGTVVNLSIEKELVSFRDKSALSLRGEFDNLFDGKNEMYWGYPGAGRSFYVALRYSFN